MLQKIADQIAEQFLRDPSTDPTQVLVKHAGDNNWNAQQIERAATRANRKIICGLQKQATSGHQDPHFTFPTIKTAKVIAILRPSSSGAQPSLPSTPGHTFTGEASKPLIYNIDSLADDPDKIDSKDLAIRALQMLKMKASEAKSRASRVEMALEQAIMAFEKQASHALLSGTPIEVFEAMPVADIVTKVSTKLASWGHEVKHVSDEVLVSTDHPLTKLALKIASLRLKLTEEQEFMSEAQEKVDSLTFRIKDWKDA